MPQHSTFGGFVLLVIALSAAACSSKDSQTHDGANNALGKDDGVTSATSTGGDTTDGATSDDRTTDDRTTESPSTAGDMTSDSTTEETTSGETGGTGGDPYEQARIDCVARINAFRATEDLPPLERWVEQEKCTDEQSAADADDGGHANFGDCAENAQNTCPGWGSVDQIIQGCLQSMWDEGPGEDFQKHGHYLNMSNTSYTRVACGFFEMPSGEIWSNQNFK